MVKETIAAKFLISGGMGLFGALVHVSTQYRKALSSGAMFSWKDALVLFVTALFSGMMFGLVAMLLSDNELHLMLACSAGSFLGLAGLTKITDIILSVLARKS